MIRALTATGLAATGVAATGLAALLSTAARAEGLVLSLSNERVAISSNFTGAQVTLFGVVERDAQSVARGDAYDVVVTVRGPREAITIRRKEAIGPVWLNREQQKFVAVPALLGVYASRPVQQIASEALRQRNRIGIDAIIGAPDITLERGHKEDRFRAALVRLKARDGLYVESGTGVTFITGTAFRARIPLPAIAPLGEYRIDAALLAGGSVLTRSAVAFRLEKAGVEETISGMARDRSWLYGLGTAAMALGFGWFASLIFRRD